MSHMADESGIEEVVAGFACSTVAHELCSALFAPFPVYVAVNCKGEKT